MERDRAKFTNRHALIWVSPDDCDPPHRALPEKVQRFVEKTETETGTK